MSKKAPGGTARQPRNKSSGISPLLVGGLVLIVVAVGILAWVALAPNKGGGVPQIQVSAERLELGKQIFDRPVRASFTVTNAGNGALTLNVPRIATVLEGC